MRAAVPCRDGGGGGTLLLSWPRLHAAAFAGDAATVATCLARGDDVRARDCALGLRATGVVRLGGHAVLAAELDGAARGGGGGGEEGVGGALAACARQI